MPKQRRLERIGLVAPTLSRARSTAAALSGRFSGARVSPVSLADLLLRGPAAERLLLCPGGSDVERDMRFLARVSARALWPAPEADLHGAIAGLLGRELPDSSAPVARGRSNRKVALLFEGSVTPARVRAAVASDARHWIVESARCVRLSERHLARLRGLGVRWSALEPVHVVAVLASPKLARARRRWQRLLPAGTPVWVWKESPPSLVLRGPSSEERPRRPRRR